MPATPPAMHSFVPSVTTTAERARKKREPHKPWLGPWVPDQAFLQCGMQSRGATRVQCNLLRCLASCSAPSSDPRDCKAPQVHFWQVYRGFRTPLSAHCNAISRTHEGAVQLAAVPTKLQRAEAPPRWAAPTPRTGRWAWDTSEGGGGGAGASHPRPQGLRATWAQQSGQTHDAQRTATTPSDPTPNRNDPRCTKTPLLQKNDLSEIAPILDVPTLPSWFWFTGAYTGGRRQWRSR